VIDRRRIALILLVLGAGLAAVGSFQDTYRTLYPGFGGPDQTLTTSLWIVTEEPSSEGLPQQVFNASGWPVIIAAVLVVVAAVLVVGERTAFIGRPVAMGAAGALAGIVFAYVLQVQREQEIMASWPVEPGQQPQLSFLGGTYLLGAAAIVALAGAVLVQREQQAGEEELDEEAVVVHQLDADDDTPPFGIAIPGEEQQQETP
jgi:hypothetical protein